MYGLHISGLADEALTALVPVAPDAPEVVVEVVLGSSLADVERSDPDIVTLAVERGVRYDIFREPAGATLTLQRLPAPRTLAHPLLAVVASVHSRWRGALTLHGGAFVLGGRAWGVLGERNDGKSSILAGLAGRGVPIMTDDLVVVDAGHVLAGPRTVDLREDGVGRFAGSEYIGVTGTRHRHRITLPEAPERAPVAGFVTLKWCDDEGASLHRVALTDRLRSLTRHEAMPLMGAQPAELLFPALDLEMFELRRPKAWELHERVLDTLIELGEVSC